MCKLDIGQGWKSPIESTNKFKYSQLENQIFQKLLFSATHKQYSQKINPILQIALFHNHCFLFFCIENNNFAKKMKLGMHS